MKLNRKAYNALKVEIISKGKCKIIMKTNGQYSIQVILVMHKYQKEAKRNWKAFTKILILNTTRRPTTKSYEERGITSMIGQDADLRSG